MYIRKRSFFEIIFPITALLFVCIGVSFISRIGAHEMRWIFFPMLFLYLFLNKKLLIYVTDSQKIIVLAYPIWCVLTTIWSDVPLLSFSKSALFTLNVVTMLSAGSIWAVKYGYARSSSWFFPIVVATLISGFFGGAHVYKMTQLHVYVYGGLAGNSNNFGFLTAMISGYILQQIYLCRKNRILLCLWMSLLIADIAYLLMSSSRSAFVIFLCIVALFTISFPMSKKLLATITTFFVLMIALTMLPLGYLEKLILMNVNKSTNITTVSDTTVLNSRHDVWEKSYEHAMKGRITGGGFDVNIGEHDFSVKKLSGMGYGREKGNSQLAILEETGIVGFILYTIFLISFFAYSVNHYLRLTGSNKIIFGIVMGSILGLIMQSLVEAWWDSAAGPELICFWTFVGIIYGMIYSDKQVSSLRAH